MPGRAWLRLSHRSDTAEVRVRSQIIPCEICGVQSGNGTGFSPSTSVSPVSIISPMLHTHLHLHVALTRRTNRRSPETFQKAMVLQITGALYRPVFSHLFFRTLCLLAVMQPHSTNGPQSADSNLAIVQLLSFTMNRAPPYATNRFTQLIPCTGRPGQPVMWCQQLWQYLVCMRAS